MRSGWGWLPWAAWEPSETSPTQSHVLKAYGAAGKDSNCTLLKDKFLLEFKVAKITRLRLHSTSPPKMGC